jgi:hypothetical protein
MIVKESVDLKTKRKMTHGALIKRLHCIALKSSAGKPVRIGSRPVQTWADFVVDGGIRVIFPDMAGP